MVSNDFIIKAGEFKKYVGTCRDVVIPDNVTGINKSAFENCKELLQ